MSAASVASGASAAESAEGASAAESAGASGASVASVAAVSAGAETSPSGSAAKSSATETLLLKLASRTDCSFIGGSCVAPPGVFFSLPVPRHFESIHARPLRPPYADDGGKQQF